MLHSEQVKPVAHFGGQEKLATTLVGSSFVRLRNVSWLRGSVFGFAGISGILRPISQTQNQPAAAMNAWLFRNQNGGKEKRGEQGDRQKSEEICPPRPEGAQGQK